MCLDDRKSYKIVLILVLIWVMIHPIIASSCYKINFKGENYTFISTVGGNPVRILNYRFDE